MEKTFEWENKEFVDRPVAENQIRLVSVPVEVITRWVKIEESEEEDAFEGYEFEVLPNQRFLLGRGCDAGVCLATILPPKP